jgi:hypothetical protein
MGVFRGIAVLLFLVAAVCGLMVVMNWHTATLGGRNLRHLLVPASIFLALGIGVFMRRKSAALTVAAGSLGWAGWLVISSVQSVPMPWLLVNLLFAIPLIILAVLILRKRRTYLSDGSLARRSGLARETNYGCPRSHI